MASGQLAKNADGERAIARPFENWSVQEIRDSVHKFATTCNIPAAKKPYLERGAFLARSPSNYKELGYNPWQQFRGHNHPDHDEGHDEGHDVHTDGGARGVGSIDQHENTAEQTTWVTEDGLVLVEKYEFDYLELEKKANMTEILSTLWNKITSWFFRQDNDSKQGSEAPWRAYPAKLYWLVACCCMCAAVQGFDEAVVNGAQAFYRKELFDLTDNIDNRNDSLKLGLVNGAPYAVSSVACLFTHLVNRIPFAVNGRLGRRGVMSFCCLISLAASLAQGFTRSWTTLLIVRSILGLGIGPKSATVPIYTAECAPYQLRGAALTMWQMWTAFGIMCGFISCLITWNWDSQWHWMLGSACLFPAIPAVLIWAVPESPRFLIQYAIHSAGDRDQKAFYIDRALKSLQSLNRTELQAYRELFYLYHSLKAENHPKGWKRVLGQPVVEPRTRRALVASMITMILQQLCGVNVLAYYSTTIVHAINSFEDDSKGFNAMKYSLGLGIVNFILALPAFFLMDSFGRRSLLLVAFPLLAVCQVMIVGGVSDHSGERGNPELSITAMFIFFAVYSFSEGPVPFSYAAESMPLRHRDQGMGYATSVNWAFNFLLAFLWPIMSKKMSDKGAFGLYLGFCVAGWFMILIFVRETRNRTLEGMSLVFSMSTRDYVGFAWRQVCYWWKCAKSRRIDFPDRPNFDDYVMELENRSKRSDEEQEGAIPLSGVSGV